MSIFKKNLIILFSVKVMVIQAEIFYLEKFINIQ